MSLECIATAARWHFEFLQLAGLTAAQAVPLQMGAAAAALGWHWAGCVCPCSEHWAVSLGFVLRQSIDQLLLFCQLPPNFSNCPPFPLGTMVKEAVALWL